MGSTSSVTIPAENYTYDASGKLLSVTSDSYYGTSYTYASSGHGLDSFFRVLGGVDGHYLDAGALWSLQSDVEFTFFPLYAILINNDVELFTTVHKYGLINEVRSIPNGSNFPNTETFSFQNKLDSRQRIVQTDIMNNGQLYASWKIKYLEQ